MKRIDTMSIRDILRHHHDLGLPRAEIAVAVSVSAGTVSNVLERAQAAGLSWPLPSDLDDDGLRARLYPPAARESQRSRTRCSTAWSTTPIASSSRESRSGSATSRRHSTAATATEPRPDGRGPWAPAAPSRLPGRRCAAACCVCELAAAPRRPFACPRGLAYARLGLAKGQPPDITKGRVPPPNPGETAR